MPSYIYCGRRPCRYQDAILDNARGCYLTYMKRKKREPPPPKTVTAVLVMTPSYPESTGAPTSLSEFIAASKAAAVNHLSGEGPKGQGLTIIMGNEAGGARQHSSSPHICALFLVGWTYGSRIGVIFFDRSGFSCECDIASVSLDAFPASRTTTLDLRPIDTGGACRFPLAAREHRRITSMRYRPATAVLHRQSDTAARFRPRTITSAEPSKWHYPWSRRSLRARRGVGYGAAGQHRR